VSPEKEAVFGTAAFQVISSSFEILQLLNIDDISSAETEVDQIIVVSCAAEPIRLQVSNIFHPLSLQYVYVNRCIPFKLSGIRVIVAPWALIFTNS